VLANTRSSYIRHRDNTLSVAILNLETTSEGNPSPTVPNEKNRLVGIFTEIVSQLLARVKHENPVKHLSLAYGDTMRLCSCGISANLMKN